MKVLGAAYMLCGGLGLYAAIHFALEIVTHLNTHDEALSNLGAALWRLALGSYLGVTGRRLYSMVPSGRKHAIVIAVLLALVFPVGTVLGISAVALLLSAKGRFVFSESYRSAGAKATVTAYSAWVVWLLAVTTVLTALLIAGVRKGLAA